MIITGTVMTVTGSLSRVNIGGSLSTPMPRLTSAYRLHVSLPDTVELLPPVAGDSVLCWFPGDAFCDGWIIGILEE